MENGLTIQLTNSVTSTPLGFLPTARIAMKSTFIIMGMIISQMNTAMGRLIWLPVPNSRARKSPTRAGANFPSATPANMQSATHRLK